MGAPIQWERKHCLAEEKRKESKHVNGPEETMSFF
jgi:hypothetical protein